MQVFQKGSPIAKDFSRAILQFSENEFLLSLEKEWFSPSLECSAGVTNSSTTDSLSIRSFWGLYIISGATSTLCFLFFSMHLLKKYYRHRVDNVDESQCLDQGNSSCQILLSGKCGFSSTGSFSSS
ncbi:hypothetical protein J1N35_031107 [Gossypium stocksii]|uniref:Uncharacterized protein n=1 Tax=Gossypium stocksii TaxID=47602 RepID=A0A9D3V0H9_9ROSI|nr:hypothetical protein J1N35_031107 [Gossypium stocksii]